MARAVRKPQAAVPTPVEAPQPPAPVEAGDTDALFRAATGSTSRSLQSALLSDVVGALGVPSDSDAYAARGGAAVALMKGLSPQNETEGALSAQFSALHFAAMSALKRAASPCLPAEVASRLTRDAANLVRCASTVVETIHALRGGGGRQRITVEHISQAIIGVPPKEGGHG